MPWNLNHWPQGKFASGPVNEWILMTGNNNWHYCELAWHGALLEPLYMAPTYPLEEGSSTPLQSSCLEKPVDGGGACWAAVRGVTESGTTERLHFPFSLSCIGEGNGSPLQGSCLENPGDGGAWWAAVYGVAESDTTEVTQQQQQQLTLLVYILIVWSH